MSGVFAPLGLNLEQEIQQRGITPVCGVGGLASRILVLLRWLVVRLCWVSPVSRKRDRLA